LKQALNIAISGGGIAGLTTALALSKNGHSITVFERAKTLDDIGAGIQLSPNANRVLRGLGLADSVRAVCFEPDILQLANGKTGRVLSTLPIKTMMMKRYDAPYLVAHRGDLQSVLLAAANANPLITIETGTEIAKLSETAEGIVTEQQSFDAMIAADGIHSALRAQIDPSATVITDGQIAWRATLPIEYMPSLQNGVTAFLNSGAHLVAYKMGQRPELNLVYVSGSDHEPSGNGFGGPAKELINAAKGWKAWPLASVQCHNWHKGCAVIIGDAAHAMTPHAAQGGAMAIEDAIALADCIQNNPSIQIAFEAFQTQRQPRIARVAALSRQNRAIYQMGGIMAFGRNAVTPLLPPERLLQRLDWLYGCDGVSPD
jgi:salicylate hydroxylase